MDDQERADLHRALDRILDAVDQLPERDETKNRWQRILDALHDLNAILTGAEPILRELWEAVPENTEPAGAIRWPVIHVLTKLRPLLPSEVWESFVLALIGLESGESSEVFEPKRPLRRKGWQAREELPQIMGALVIWWGKTLEKDGKPIGVTSAAHHACQVLGLQEARTAEKWMEKIPERTKAAIERTAERYRAGERDLSALELDREPRYAFFAPVLAQDDNFTRGLYALLFRGATGRWPDRYFRPSPELNSKKP
jgi:hypothetical protein